MNSSFDLPDLVDLVADLAELVDEMQFRVECAAVTLDNQTHREVAVLYREHRDSLRQWRDLARQWATDNDLSEWTLTGQSLYNALEVYHARQLRELDC